MKKFLLLFALLALVAPPAIAQQQCICVGVSCRITTDPYPAGSGQPTSCTLYKNSVAPANIIATGATIPSSTIPISNATVCQPASAPYVPGPATNVSCNVIVPPQPAGTVTWLMTASTAAGEGPPSPATTFQLVATLSTVPAAPTNLRVGP